MNSSFVVVLGPLTTLVFNVLKLSLVLLFRGELTFFLGFFFTGRDFAVGLDVVVSWVFVACLEVVPG